MALESKPLFHPEVLRQQVRAFNLPERVGDWQPKLQHWASIYDKFNSARTIEILDGHQTRMVPLRGIQPGTPQLAALRKDLNVAQREHQLVKAVTPTGKKTPGITPGHAYAILGFNNETDLVHVWNPHGNNFTPKGPDGLQNGYVTKTGQFDIPLKDLLQLFNNVTFETQTLSRN